MPWQHAIDQAADDLIRYRGRIGIVFSPQITVEAIDRLIIMAKALKAPLAPSININGYRGFNLMNIARNACLIVLNTDLIADFSPWFLRLRRRSPNARIIVIDSVENDLIDKADMFIRIAPRTESLALKELLRKKPGKPKIIANNTWQEYQDLSSRRKIYLIYHPVHVDGVKLPAGPVLVPVLTAPNASYLSKHNLSNAADLYGDKNIDCLCIIGKKPDLKRRYERIINQDCFIPDNEVSVFLPASAFTEVRGSVFGADGRMKKLKPIVAPKGESRSDVEIIDALIEKMAVNPAAAKKQVLRRAKTAVRRSKNTADNGWHLIVRENGYAYRNTRLSSLLHGFERLRADRFMHINPVDARQHGIRDGSRIRLVGTELDVEGIAKVSARVPPRSILVYRAGDYPRPCTRTVRLECIE